MTRDLLSDGPVTATRAGGRFGAAMALLAMVGLAIAVYLLASRILGEPPACGPVKGCETVAASEYATFFGFPVALFGVAFSAILAVLCAAWWRRADPRALYAAYALGLSGVIAVAYLTYLEVFVIGAICVWCVGYAATVVATCALAATAAFSEAGSSGRRGPRP
jgi:uncharacterized membrane protein